MMLEVKSREAEEVQAEGILATSYVSGPSDKPLLGLTIGDMFDQIVEKYPDNEALVSRHQGVGLTYRQLHQEVNRFARGLMRLGLQKGQRIGIWSPRGGYIGHTEYN